VNVTFEEKDALNALLTIEMNPEDYQEKVSEELKRYRKQAKIPGFRPGQAPLGMVKKMVGSSLLVDTINQLASTKLHDYLREEKIDILGQPLASSEKEAQADFDNPKDFTFYFDLGLAPKFELNISEKDKLTRYVLEVDEEEVNKEIDNTARRMGKMVETDISQEDNDSLKGILTELDDKGKKLEGGVEGKETTVLIEMVKDSKVKKALKGLKVGDKTKVDIFKLFNDNKKVIASTVGLPEEGVDDLNKNFEFEILEIKQFVPAEVNQELFDAVYGEGLVKSEEEFREKMRENIEGYYKAEAENHLDHMVSHLVQDKHTFALPDDFLKRWLVQTYPETYTAENIEEKYEEEVSRLRNQLVTEKVVSEYKLEITKEDINEVSYGYTVQMLRQYGLNNPDFETVRQFEERNREDQNYMLRMRDIAVDRKVTQQVKQLIKINEKKIKIDKFYKMLEEHNEQHQH
jgi:trigger factor